MNKKTKNYLALILAVLMLASVAAPAFAANAPEPEPGKYSNMLVFGDSIMSADELPVPPTDFAPSECSYANVLSKMLGLDTYTSFAFRGARTIDALYLLGIAPKNYSKLNSCDYVSRAAGESVWNTFIDTAAGKNPAFGNPRDVVKGSDLIVIQLGNNDIAGYPFFESDVDFGKLSTKEGRDNLADFAAKSAQGMAQALSYYPKLVKEIRSINPDADIVLVSNYNPFINMSYSSGGIDIALGGLISVSTETVNSMIYELAVKYNCTYADIFDYGYSFPEQNIANGFALRGIHPTVEGHKWIANRIYSTLANGRTIAGPVNGELSLRFDGSYAGNYELSGAGFMWNIKDAATGKYIAVGSDGNIIQRDCGSLWLYNGGFYRFSMVKVDNRFGSQYLKFTKEYLTSDGNNGLMTASSFGRVTLYSNK